MLHVFRFVLLASVIVGVFYCGFRVVIAESSVEVDIAMATSTERMSEVSTSTTQGYDQIVINEVLVQPRDGEKEWIELYNMSDVIIDIQGLTLSDEIGVIAIVSSTISPHEFVVIELPKSVLNNTGDGIFLRHKDELIDSLIYGNAKTEPRDSEKVPGVGQTITRQENGAFSIVSTPTKGAKNIFLEQIILESESNTSTVSSVTPSVVPKGAIIITEFLSDPTDEAEEFIELFNGSSERVDLTEWYIEDSGETKTILSGSIDANDFFIIEKPKGALNNTGDEIILYVRSGEVMDRVTYGTIDDGNVSDNAPVAKDPMSVARLPDATQTGNNSQDFSITTRITKGTKNIIISPVQTVTAVESTEEVIEKNIVITEIFPNPKGVDTEKEFIEIKNISTQDVDISGWKIGDSSKTRYVILVDVMRPGDRRVYYRKETKISLNNSGSDSVKLFTASGALADSVAYDGGVGEDESYSRGVDGAFVRTTAITPGEENIFVKKNHAPVAEVTLPKKSSVGEVIVFDASDTTDEDQDTLTFTWFVNNQKIAEGALAQYTFTDPGKHIVSLAVSDGVNDVVKEQKKIDVKQSETATILAGSGQFDTLIRVSEIFPDPEGSDTEEEFIELYNEGEYEVDISGWYIDDTEGGSRAFRVPDGTVIAPKQYMVFDRTLTGIALNNTNDSARLLFPDKTLAEEIIMSEVLEGAVFIKQGIGEWVWSSSGTPGEANIFTAIVVEMQKKKKIKGKDGKIISKTTIEDLREHEPGDLVMVQGTVAVKPGIFSTTVFYIVNRAGIQISMPKKLMPKIEVGDVVELTGVLSEIKGERRIGVKNKEDARIIRPGVVPEIQKEEIALLGEEKVGSLGMVEGEVMEKKGSTIYIDDGTDELSVVLPKGVKPKEAVTEGDIVRVAGIIRFKGEEVYIMPRTSDDIQKMGVATTTQGMEEEYIKEKKAYTPYVFMSGSTVGIVALVWYVRKKRTNVQ